MNNIIRVEHSKNYTVISNDAIRDKRISLKARGLHHLLLSYPDNWRISIEHLAEEASEKDARTAIQSALKELEKFGYLAREQVRDERGRITGWENVVRELPQAGFPNMEKSTSGKHHSRKNRKRENPNMDNPQVENPAAENQYLINTDSYEVSNYEIPIPPTPQGEEMGVNEKTALLEEELGASTEHPLPDQTNQFTTSKDSQSIRETKDSAAACDNSARYIRNERQYPKSINGLDRLPWETGKQGVFDAGFEKHMTSSLKDFPAYKGALAGELLIKVRKHISGGKYDLKRRDELAIEWDAYQARLNTPSQKSLEPPKPIAGTEPIAPEQARSVLNQLRRLAK